MIADKPSSADGQLERLTGFGISFRERVGSLRARSLKILQINLGKKCNQACKHCHVDAGPGRKESMSRETAEMCVSLIRNLPEIRTVDITGGAPEMNEQFRFLVEEAVRAGKHVIDRCNLTILEETGYEYLYDFLSSRKVEIIASLPHFSAARTDGQRGTGVFETSVITLKKLNQLGYGRRPELPLNLVYNPAGLFLSAPQSELEREFKSALKQKFGIDFQNLYCINNMPISRFLESLLRRNQFEHYMNVLVNAYNPATLDGLMCLDQISVSWDGFLYDCDFNQMLDLKTRPIDRLSDFDSDALRQREIRLANHCFGCTAGSGSSCGGELV